MLEKVNTVLLAAVFALIGVIYWDIISRLNSLELSYRTADRSGVKVEELFAKSPKLDEQINEIRVNVSGFPEMKKTVNATHDSVIKLVATMEQFQRDIKDQLTIMQYQIQYQDKQK